MTKQRVTRREFVQDLGNDLDPSTPELEIPVSENLTIAVTSVEHNFGPGEALSTITFLADIPKGCEGQWVPPVFPEINTMRPYDPGFPLDQGTGNGPTPGKDPGDGILGTAESVAAGEIPEPVSQDIVVTQYFELHCYEPSFHVFHFVNKQEVLPPQIDPDLSNNFKYIDVVVAAIAQADGAVLDMFVVDPPSEIDVSDNVDITVREVVHNFGPFGPAEFDVTFNAAAPDGCEIVGEDQKVVRVNLPVSEDTNVDATFTIHCSKPSLHTFSFDNEITPVDPHVVDPNPGNNTGATSLTVAAIAYADVEIVDWEVPVPQSAATDLEPGYLLISEWVTIYTVKTLHNLGPWGPVDVVGATSVDAPGIDVSGPDSFAVVDLEVSVPVDVEEDFEIHCYEPSHHTITLRNEVTDVEPEDIHVIDPNPDNDRIERTLEIECVIPVDTDIKPGSFPNSINMKSKGKIPVAILSSETFDAPSQVGPESPTFGRTGTEESLDFCNPSPEDVNGDGLLDMVCHFNTQETGFVEGDELGILRGYTVDGHLFRSEDSVRIVPKGK